jgi:hypothetical protein
MLKPRRRLAAVVSVAAFAALSTAVMALPAAAATQTGTETVTLTAGSLSIAGCGTCSAALSGPVGPLAIVGGAPAAIWTDATGSGTGWDGTLQATTMVYTGNWAQTGGTTVPGGGSAVKFVTAAANTGMGAYQVTPGVQVTPDASTWAGVAYASTLTYTIVSGP